MTRRRRAVVGILAFAVLLIAVRAALPIYVERYVNRRLDRIPEYGGRIGDVDLHLWRGAYSIDNIELVKTTGKVPVPLFSAPHVAFTVQWKALWEGKIVGEIEIERGKLNFVNAPSDKNSQLEVDDEWLQAVKDLYPFRINKFTLRDCEIHFRDFHQDPKVDVELSSVQLVGRDFSNTREPAEGLVAVIEASATAEKHAALKVSAVVAPAADEPTFTLDASLRGLKLTALNDVLRAYAGVDAEGGDVSIDTEMKAENGNFNGYVKPLIRDAQLFSLKKDSDSLLELAWEGFVGFFAEVFENQSRDQIGTRAPFSGSFGDTETDWLETILEVFKNAFIEALKQGVEGSVDLEKSAGE